MCLYVTSKTKKRLKFKNGKITLYKMLYYEDGKDMIVTPYRYTPVPRAGYFKAVGNPYFYYEFYKQSLGYGAIHVFTSRKRALRSARRYPTNIIVRVVCLEKDLIAEGEDSEAAFSKIFIPKAELDMAKKVVKARLTKNKEQVYSTQYW